jgi:cell division protein FtsQ
MSDGTEAAKPESSPTVRRIKLVLGALGVVAILTSPAWGPALMRRMAFFRVRRVEILGAHYVAPSDILAKLHVDTLASVWDPTGPIVARLATEPGIRNVEVHRKLPGTLVVKVTERVPVALVSSPTGLLAYDAQGGALPADPVRVAVDAPILDEADTTLLHLLGAMRDSMPALYDRVSSARRAGKARDEVLFELARLPVRTMLDVSLTRLTEIEPVEADLTRRGVRASELDLRYRDQVIVRFP